MSYTENFINSGIWNSIDRWIPDCSEDLEESLDDTGISSFNYEEWLKTSLSDEPACPKCGDSGCYSCMDCDKDYWSL